MLAAAPALAEVKTVNGISVETNLPNIERGVPYSFQIAPTGPSGYAGPYSFSILSANLPAGITISSSGLVSGTTCSANGIYAPQNLRVQTNTGVAADFIDGDAFGINVTNSPSNACSVTVTAMTPPATQGVAYNGQVTASGANTPYIYSINSGALPPGVTLNSSTGALTGTPIVPGTYTFTVLATDNSSSPSSTGVGGPFTISVAGSASLTINPATPSNGTAGTAYTETVSATGGTAPYTFAVTSGTLPAGLTLASNGALSGTPTTPGTFAFTVTGRDANGNSGTRNYSVTIAAGSTLTINPTTLPDGSAGTAYSQTISATGGTAPLSFAVTSGTLPTGLTLASTGALSGTPTTQGTFSFTVTGTDASGNFGTRNYSVTIAAGNTPTINPSTLPNATNGTAYSQVITASGGTGPYTFAVTSGALPPGFALASNGTLSGNPMVAGTFNFSVAGRDANGNIGTRSYSLVVAGSNIITVNPASLPNGTAGTAYSQTVSATGGTAPFTLAVTSGTLPTGLTLASNGALSGTPTTSGTFAFTVTGTDANGNFGTRNYSVTIAAGNTLTINPSTLPNATNGTAYSQTITATGGTGPYTFAVTSGTLPTGLTLASNGTLSGTPTAAGTYTFTVTGTDANGNFGTRSYSLIVAGGNIVTVNPATLPNGTAGTAYSQTISATGGTAPYTFAVTSGTLPAGLTLASNGALSGTPTTPGTFAFTVTGTDANGNFGTRNYSVTIAAGNTLTINPSTLPNATNGTVYSQTITATGGTGPYTFAVTSGALPTGLILASNGTLSGTPTVAGTYNFTITGTDANGNFGTRSYSVVVAGRQSLTVTPANPPAGNAGTPYNLQFNSTGGTAPYTYAVVSGALPPGLTFSTGGALTGTPTTPGTYTFGVRSVDATGNFGIIQVTLVIGLSIRPDPTLNVGVVDGIIEQVGAARRAGELQMSHTMRRLGAPGNCSDADSTERRNDCDKMAVWATGTREQNFSERGASNVSALTVGADTRIGKALVGLAIGTGKDSVDTASGTKNDADATSLMLYGRWDIQSNVYLEALAGRSSMDFDTSRQVPDGTIATGQREGDTTFGSLGIAGNFAMGQLGLHPYARYETIRINLDGYKETATSPLALQYDALRTRTSSWVLGTEAAYSMQLGWGQLTPSARMEYRDRSGQALAQQLWYTDRPETIYLFNQAGISSGSFLAALGLEAAFNGKTLKLEYGTAGSALDSLDGQTIQLQFRTQF